MRRGLDHHDLAVDHDRAARLGQPAGKRRDLGGCRVVAPQRSVVRVADRDGPVRQDGDRERMLQAGLRGRPVDVPEVEESLADRCVQGSLGVEVPQRGRLGVGEPEALAVDRQAGRLGEPALQRRTVAQPLDGRPGEDLDSVRGRIPAE